MKKFIIITSLIALVAVSCKKAEITTDAEAITPSLNSSEVAVTITGGYETVASDGGRPTVLIAAALNVTQAQFQDAFSRVTPARGSEPTLAQELANKAALLSTLASLGVTNERLDAVSNFYRYLDSAGQVWQRTPAAATATVVNGIVTKITITNAGAGYSSVPAITVPGSSTKIVGAVSYGTDLATNGKILAMTIQ